MPLATRSTASRSALSALLRPSAAPRSSPRLFQLKVRSIATRRSQDAALKTPNAARGQRVWLPWSVSSTRALHQTAARRGIMPDAENPQPKDSEPNEEAMAAANISYEEYHQLADYYLEELVAKLEEMQETRSDLEVEYAAGVLTIELVGKGTYVLNKQPPNKQIWLSSPVTGPKRFDWVVVGESMNQKEDGGVGDWIYIRDGTSLTELLKKEIGVDLSVDGSIA